MILSVRRREPVKAILIAPENHADLTSQYEGDYANEWATNLIAEDASLYLLSIPGRFGNVFSILTYEELVSEYDIL